MQSFKTRSVRIPPQITNIPNPYLPKKSLPNHTIFRFTSDVILHTKEELFLYVYLPIPHTASHQFFYPWYVMKDLPILLIPFLNAIGDCILNDGSPGMIEVLSTLFVQDGVTQPVNRIEHISYQATSQACRAV